MIELGWSGCVAVSGLRFWSYGTRSSRAHPHLHNLANGDLRGALQGLLGQDGPLSAGTGAQFLVGWRAEAKMWSAPRKGVMV